MEIEILKLFHWVSIVLFLTLASISLWYGDRSKFLSIFVGVSTLFILISGLLMCWFNELALWGDWPNWLNFKIVSWLVLGSLVPIIVRRAPRLGKITYFVMMGIVLSVFYIVLYKEI